MKPISILVADDEPGMRDLLHMWLDRDGHHVSCARSGHEAAELMKKERFDVVIADVLMPDGDGLELITESKKTHPDARIVAISGGGRYLHGSECLNVATGLGAHAAVLKPFSIDQLFTSIHEALIAS
jgi:two-component system chemotaxis response regulator CheY